MQVRGRRYEGVDTRENRWRTRPARLSQHAVLVAPNTGDPWDTRVFRIFSRIRHRAACFHPSRIGPADKVAEGKTERRLELHQQHRGCQESAHTGR
jgi:hypothetical protein